MYDLNKLLLKKDVYEVLVFLIELWCQLVIP